MSKDDSLVRIYYLLQTENQIKMGRGECRRHRAGRKVREETRETKTQARKPETKAQPVPPAACEGEGSAWPTTVTVPRMPAPPPEPDGARPAPLGWPRAPRCPGPDTSILEPRAPLLAAGRLRRFSNRSPTPPLHGPRQGEAGGGRLNVDALPPGTRPRQPASRGHQRWKEDEQRKRFPSTFTTPARHRNALGRQGGPDWPQEQRRPCPPGAWGAGWGRGRDSLPRPAAAPPLTPRPIPDSFRDPRAVVGAYLGLTVEVLRAPMTEMQWSVKVSGCSATLPTALPAPALHGGHLESWLLPSKGWPRFNSLRPCRAPTARSTPIHHCPGSGVSSTVSLPSAPSWAPSAPASPLQVSAQA